jgi:hypothetical protein
MARAIPKLIYRHLIELVDVLRDIEVRTDYLGYSPNIIAIETDYPDTR